MITFEEFLAEKELTPEEEKKRDEIVEKLKKENEDKEDGEKLAIGAIYGIATKQAKAAA